MQSMGIWWDLRSAVENRLKDMEARMDVTHIQVTKMDELREHLHDESQRLKAWLKVRWTPLCEKWNGMKTQDPRKNVDKKSLTAVIGNLPGVSSLAQTQAVRPWGPFPNSGLRQRAVPRYGVSGDEGPVWQRLALTLVNTAGLQQNGQPLRISQDPSPCWKSRSQLLFWLAKYYLRKL